MDNLNGSSGGKTQALRLTSRDFTTAMKETSFGAVSGQTKGNL